MSFLQVIGYTFSFLFAILIVVFFVWGIYVGYKNYDELGDSKSAGLRYLLLSALSMGLSLFVFLTVENGFTWETLCFSSGLVFTIGFFMYVDDLIRRKVVKELHKRGTATPGAAMSKLFDLLNSKTINNKNDEVDKKE